DRLVRDAEPAVLGRDRDVEDLSLAPDLEGERTLRRRSDESGNIPERRDRLAVHGQDPVVGLEPRALRGRTREHLADAHETRDADLPHLLRPAGGGLADQLHVLIAAP